MITLPLQMRYSDKPRRPAGAWLIPGAEPHIWLDEMLGWDVPLDAAALYLVPRSASDLSPQGVLVVLPTRLQPKTTQRSQPFAAVRKQRTHLAERDEYVLYLPVEARFEPDASDAEAAALACTAGDCLLHPTAGAIRLEASDRRRVADLLTRPAERSVPWDLAEPGQHFNSRLTAIVAAEMPSPEDLLERGRGDIGDAQGSLGDIPAAPDEPSNSLLARAARGVQRKLAAAVQKLAAHLPKTDPRRSDESRQARARRQSTSRGEASAKPGLLSQMANWAQNKIRQLDEAMLKNRHRELHRLMHLLENDPDRGLRYAPPCGGEKHRGIAPPGDKLAERDVNFDLRRLGGGQPGDPWLLPSDLYVILHAKYLELAGRELRLGRYRRAAYIYAHLLHDFTNAAAALAAGRHWREAAAIYRDRLHRPDEAARLLERGGLWGEAIELYQQQGNHEKVGDLCAQLQQPEEAEKAWRRAVEEKLGRRDNLAAARLLETKLKSPDAALDVLALAWPHEPQAAACLAEQFALLARLGRHEAARQRVEELRAGHWPNDLRPRAIDRLADAATSYPNDAVRSAAADAVRTMAASQLPAANAAQLEHLLNAIRRLEPADRLLERDTARFRRQRTKPRLPATKPATRADSLTTRGYFRLPGKARWECAVSCGEHFYAAGFDDRTLCLAQMPWEGPSRLHTRNVTNVAPIILSIDARDQEGVLHLVQGDRLPAVAFVPTDSVPRSCEIGSPTWIAKETVAVAHHTGGWYVLAATDAGFVLNRLGLHGIPLGSQLIPYDVVFGDEDDGQLPVQPVPMFARESSVLLGIGQRLLLVTGEKAVRTFDLPSEIRGFCGSSPFAVGRVVATLQQGAALFWEYTEAIVRFGEELTAPKGCITISGSIVLASADTIQIYQTDERTIKLSLRQSRNGIPAAVLPTAQRDGFAIVREDGVVEMYQLPRR